MAVATLLAVYLAIAFFSMPRPRGLKIIAPEQGSSELKAGNSNTNIQNFAAIDPVEFSAAFGLDYNKAPEPEPEPIKVETPKPEPVKPVMAQVETGPKSLDLAAAGYRLKGIILEKDGNSAAFVFDPQSKKTLVVREKSGETLRIISATMRSIRLQTPDGEGDLELEDPKGHKGGGFSTFNRSSAGATPAAMQQAASRAVKSEKLLRSTETSANSIADMVSAGHFQVRPFKGNFQVEVRRIPDAFAGYGLQPGDKIVGTAKGNFTQSQDVALQLGQISERPMPIKIQRGRRTMYLNPPPRTDKKSSGKDSR